MKTYIALLRGINVGGHRKILMTDLKRMMNSIGYENSITYIQSGNIIFKSSEKNISTIAEKITLTISKDFGYDVPTLVITRDELLKIIKGNSYSKENINQLYFSFLYSTPTQENINILYSSEFGNDTFTVKDKGVYILFSTKASKSKLSNNSIEKKLNVSSTSRNWKTMLKLETLAQEIS